jgi:hypothetical protein
MYVGTITSIDSATQIGVTPNISTTVSGVVGLQFGTDNTAAITMMQSTVNNDPFPGARIIFNNSATNSYGFPIKVLFNKNCQIEGIGGGHTTDSGDYTRIGGTRLAWWGTSYDSGTPFTPFITFTPSGVQSLKHVALRRCWLDCRNGDQNQAVIGLKLASCHGFVLSDFFVNDALGQGIWTNISSTPSGDAADTTRFLIENICSRQLDSPSGAMTTPVTTSSAVTLTTTGQSLTVAANTLPASGYIWVATTTGSPILVNYTGGGGTTTLTGCTVAAEEGVDAPVTVNGGNLVQSVPGNACSLYFDGGTAANTCCGVVMMGQLSHGTTWGPAAIELANSDSIDFIQVLCNGGNPTNLGAINRVTKPGVRINGSNTNATLASRNNTFHGGSAGAGGVSHMGLTATGSRLLAMAGPTYWDYYQLGNGEAIPNVEGNSPFYWSANGGFHPGSSSNASVASQAIAAATATLITGSLIAVPPQGLQVGTVLRWTITGTGGAAGTAANTIAVKAGTAGTTADAAIATYTTAVGTAAASEFKIIIELTIQTLGASGVIASECTILNSAAAGFVNTAVSVLAPTIVALNTTTSNLFLHVDITTGAAKTATIKQVTVECLNPANP